MKIGVEQKKIIIQETFYFLTVLLFSFILLEVFFSNMINNYFNLNFLLIIWLIFAFWELNLNKGK